MIAALPRDVVMAKASVLEIFRACFTEGGTVRDKPAGLPAMVLGLRCARRSTRNAPLSSCRQGP